MHPAYSISYDDLYNGLIENVKNGCITVTKKDDLELFTYTKSTVYAKNWNIYTIVSRGLILDVKNKKIIATPFPKFFNFGENVNIPNLQFIVEEKMDGSLGICYYYNNKWNFATKGSFSSNQALHAEEKLNKINTQYLDKDCTYLFEILYPDNTIVINYNYDGLVLLGGYKFGKEIDIYELDDLANKLSKDIQIKRPNRYSYNSLEDIVELCKTLPKNQEGFVVKYTNGEMLKVKGDAYCYLHAVMSNIKPLNIWEILKDDKDFDDIKSILPEEFTRDINNMAAIINKNYKKIYNEVMDYYQETILMSDKELALDKNIPSQYKHMVFSVRHRKINNLKSKIYEMIRPNNNVLDSYIPSNVVSRFSEEGE